MHPTVTEVPVASAGDGDLDTLEGDGGSGAPEGDDDNTVVLGSMITIAGASESVGVCQGVG